MVVRQLACYCRTFGAEGLYGSSHSGTPQARRPTIVLTAAPVHVVRAVSGSFDSIRFSHAAAAVGPAVNAAASFCSVTRTSTAAVARPHRTPPAAAAITLLRKALP